MKKVIVSGMRPTGAIHLGHYVGVIKNWVELQHDHDCYFFLADWHALTSNFDELDVIRKSRYDYVRGWIASGMDTKNAHIYNQSSCPEILYLSQIFLCLTPPGWADRSPSWKDQVQNPKKKLDNLGFYTYPVLQAADIAILKGQLVPVGEDQVAHVEIAREIVRKFNRLYGTKLPEPQSLLHSVSKLPGTDGVKMSSSIGNVILLNETEKSLQKKLNKLKTDDKRDGIEKPGNPNNCLVYEYHKVFSSKSEIEEVCQACKAAQLGCGECKKRLGDVMKKELMPIAERFNSISDQECQDIIDEGTRIVSEKVRVTWQEIMEKIRFNR